MNYFSLANLYSGLIAITCLSLFFAVCAVFQNYASDKSAKEQNAARRATLSNLKATNHAILNDSRGQQGETAVYAAVSRICTELGLSWATNRELNRPHAILLPEGDDVYSKEIDLVLVSGLGVYTFEVKNWQGQWAQQPEDHRNLQCVRANRQVEIRPAPLAKTERKLCQLIDRSDIDEVPIDAIVVFTHPQGRLDPHLPTNYLHISELEYFFRTRLADIKSEGKKWVAENWYDRIKNSLDDSPYALHNHFMRLSPTTDSIKTYQSNHGRILALEQQADIHVERHAALPFFGTCAVIYGVLAYIVGKFV